MLGGRKIRTPLYLAVWSFACVFVLCWRIAATFPLWSDELFTLTTAEEAPATIWRLLFKYRHDFFDHPPLYFVFMHYYLRLGNAPVVLRFPSLVFVAAAVVIWAVKERRETQSLVAGAALAVVLAIHPTLRFQATNTRMYGLFLLLTSAAILVLWRLIEPNARRRVVNACALAALLALAIYTSYFGVLFGVGVGLAGAVVALRPRWVGLADWRAGATVVLACLGAAVLTLPWGPAVIHLLEDESQARLPSGLSRSRHVLGTLTEFSGSPFGVVFLAAGLAALGAFNRARTKWALLIAGLVAAPMAILSMAAPPGRFVTPRHFIYAIPLLSAAAATGWLELTRRWMKKNRMGAALTAAILLSPAPFHYIHARAIGLAPAPDWWAAAKIIETDAQPSERILTGGYLTGEAMVYHLNHPERYSFIHYVTGIDPFYLNCRDPQVAWYVNVAPLPPPYEKILFRYFPYRVEFAGNRGLGTIQVFAKKPFTSYTGQPAPYYEPIALDYEQAAGIK